MLVFEDIHWADDGLLDFVDHLVEWVSGVPMLVVSTARPELLERRPGWGGGKVERATVSLYALSDDDTARLISALLEQAVLPAETRPSCSPAPAATRSTRGVRPDADDRRYLRREGRLDSSGRTCRCRSRSRA